MLILVLVFYERWYAGPSDSNRRFASKTSSSGWVYCRWWVSRCMAQLHCINSMLPVLCLVDLCWRASCSGYHTSQCGIHSRWGIPNRESTVSSPHPSERKPILERMCMAQGVDRWSLYCIVLLLLCRSSRKGWGTGKWIYIRRSDQTGSTCTYRKSMVVIIICSLVLVSFIISMQKHSTDRKGWWIDCNWHKSIHLTFHNGLAP